MRTLSAVALVALLAVAGHAATAIDSDRLLDHIKFLASDELKGRADGSPELNQAADYIARQFSEIGLTPGGSERSWYQPFELMAGLNVGRENSLVIAGGRGRSVRLELGVSYYPLSVIPTESIDVPSARMNGLPVVFAGFGLSAPQVSYDDYAGLDVTDKAVLIFSHEPQESDRNSPLNGNRFMAESTLMSKADAARTRGARLLLVVSDPSHATDDELYRPFGILPDADEAGFTVLRVRRTEMQPLIEAWGLDALAVQINRDLRPRSRPLTDASVNYEEHIAHNRREVRNVVGVLPGADPVKAREAIVIGAHYDHVGLGGRLSITPERTGEIHNGADDNSSGTASIIEMARAAMADRQRFPRTLVFIAFAGEERGLLGSAHYVGAPAVPIMNTVAMLNLDMVGRSRGAVDVSGLDSAMLKDELMAAARATGGLEIRQAGPGAGRSDDSSFLDARVPAVNFFTGFHTDYHRPTDDWEKIDKEGTARVATLALEFAARIASR